MADTGSLSSGVLVKPEGRLRVIRANPLDSLERRKSLAWIHHCESQARVVVPQGVDIHMCGHAPEPVAHTKVR